MRETDVLDTWFSSALWPFATLGWPRETPELERYYPGNVNVTAREIIRLWENRMIFSGLFLLGDVPFTDVIINSTVLAVDGRRMSKSLGTGIDPLDAVAEHGADATRYGLLKISSTQDVRFSWGAIEEGGKLANKLWNVARLILQKAEGAEPRLDPSSLEETWIVGRIDETRAEIEDAASRGSTSLTSPTRSTTSPSTISATGTRRRSSLGSTRMTPRRSEPRWQRSSACSRCCTPSCRTSPRRSGRSSTTRRLILGPWPEPGERDPVAAEAMERVQAAAATFRRSGALVPLEGDEKRIFDAVVKPERFARSDGRAVEDEQERLRKEIARSEAMLANERFVSKAPADVVEAEREKLERYRRELEALGG